MNSHQHRVNLTGKAIIVQLSNRQLMSQFFPNYKILTIFFANVPDGTMVCRPVGVQSQINATSEIDELQSRN